MRVGFAGLGRMGAKMALNLVTAGHDVCVWNRTAQTAADFAADTGCKYANTPAELTEFAEIIVTMLADDASSVQVHTGPNGLFAGQGATLFVEMGTMSPSHIDDLRQSAPTGCTVIDAPVSGATQAAADAALLVMAGCPETNDDRLRGLFSALARQVIYLGQPGAGAVMKLAVNSLIHGLNQTLAEALALTDAAGIMPAKAFDVIESSAAAAPMLKYRRPLYLDETAHPVTFTVALARKDMELATALAQEYGVSMPQGQITLDLLKQAEEQGFADRDMAAMVNFMRKANQ